MEDEQLEQLKVYWSKLGPQAKDIYLTIGKRMAMGAEQYGDFQPREWTTEALHEALDMVVYLSAALKFGPNPKT